MKTKNTYFLSLISTFFILSVSYLEANHDQRRQDILKEWLISKTVNITANVVERQTGIKVTESERKISERVIHYALKPNQVNFEKLNDSILSDLKTLDSETTPNSIATSYSLPQPAPSPVEQRLCNNLKTFLFSNIDKGGYDGGISELKIGNVDLDSEKELIILLWLSDPHKSFSEQYRTAEGLNEGGYFFILGQSSPDQYYIKKIVRSGANCVGLKLVDIDNDGIYEIAFEQWVLFGQGNNDAYFYMWKLMDREFKEILDCKIADHNERNISAQVSFLDVNADNIIEVKLSYPNKSIIYFWNKRNSQFEEK